MTTRSRPIVRAEAELALLIGIWPAGSNDATLLRRMMSSPPETTAVTIAGTETQDARLIDPSELGPTCILADAGAHDERQRLGRSTDIEQFHFVVRSLSDAGLAICGRMTIEGAPTRITMRPTDVALEVFQHIPRGATGVDVFRPEIGWAMLSLAPSVMMNIHSQLQTARKGGSLVNLLDAVEDR